MTSLIAAVYCRKSTEQSVADDQKLVTRQIDHARQYAERKGWMINEDCIFTDDGVSGAEFANRPGFVRLMAALKPRPAFQALIMSEDSRLGREAIETAYALKQIIQAGVRVFFYMEDRERTLDSPIEKAMLALQTMADEMEREKARLRMVDTMTRKAKAGHVTGGQCFGYDNVPVLGPNGERSHVEYRINDDEADVIRHIFELAATGRGQATIAKTLNAEGYSAPRSQRGRPRAWVQSSVHEALFRDRYRGITIWNKTKKRDRWGQQRVTDRNQGEWIRVETPHLRIVPEELWTAAHRRIAAAKADTNIRHRGRGATSRYLLPGLARCAWCNGGMHVRIRTRATGRHQRFYACTSHFNRGETVCQNVVQAPMEDVDNEVISSIKYNLRPAVVEAVIAGVREGMQPEQKAIEREALAGKIVAVECQIANLAEAIANGGNIPALVARLQDAEQARRGLATQLASLAGEVLPPRIDWRALERQVRGLLADWRGLLGRNVQDARDALRAMLEEPIRFTPILEDSQRGYRFRGNVSIGDILAGTVVVRSHGVPGQN